MWPLGHAAVAYLCYSLGSRFGYLRPLDAPVLVALLLGSQVPDLIDKPLAWYLGVLPTGRTLAHSLLFVVPLSIVAVVVARRYRRQALGVAFAIGLLSHVFVDALPVLWDGGADWEPLLWPLVSVESYEDGAPGVLALLRSSLTDPWFLFEFVLAAVALATWRRDGYPGLTWARRHASRYVPTS